MSKLLDVGPFMYNYVFVGLQVIETALDSPFLRNVIDIP